MVCRLWVGLSSTATEGWGTWRPNHVSQGSLPWTGHHVGLSLHDFFFILSGVRARQFLQPNFSCGSLWIIRDKLLGTKLSEEAHLTGSIRAFFANQIYVPVSHFLGLKCDSNILGFDSNVPPQMCLLKCASSMCLLNAPPQCRSFIIVHGWHSDDLYWIYALLSRNQPCRDYALWEALFGKI